MSDTLQRVVVSRNAHLNRNASIECTIRFSLSSLVFHHYGDIYFLAQIVSGHEGIARELQRSKQERRMEHALASNNKAPQWESVLLTAN